MEFAAHVDDICKPMPSIKTSCIMSGLYTKGIRITKIDESAPNDLIDLLRLMPEGFYISGSFAFALQCKVHNIQKHNRPPNDLDIYLTKEGRNELYDFLKTINCEKELFSMGKPLIYKGIKLNIIRYPIVSFMDIENTYDFNFLCSLYDVKNCTMIHGPRFEQFLQDGRVFTIFSSVSRSRLEKYNIGNAIYYGTKNPKIWAKYTEEMENDVESNALYKDIFVITDVDPVSWKIEQEPFTCVYRTNNGVDDAMENLSSKLNFSSIYTINFKTSKTNTKIEIEVPDLTQKEKDAIIYNLSRFVDADKEMTMKLRIDRK
jgi:hypothetical protein